MVKFLIYLNRPVFVMTCPLGNKRSKLALFVNSVLPVSSISKFLSRFARKSQHFCPRLAWRKEVLIIPGTVQYRCDLLKLSHSVKMVQYLLRNGE